MARIIFAMLRDGQPYQDPDVDYTQLMVRANAPRWLRMLKNYGYLESLRAAAKAEPTRSINRE